MAAKWSNEYAVVAEHKDLQVIAYIYHHSSLYIL